MEESQLKKLIQLQQWVAEQYNNLEQWEQSPGTAQMRTYDTAMMLKSIGASLDDILREAGAISTQDA